MKAHLAPALLLAALLAFFPAGFTSARTVSALPPYPADTLADAERALESLTAEMAELSAAHPSLFPAPPEDRWSQFLPAYPQIAISTAASSLGDMRVRESLGMPAGEMNTTLSQEEFSTWLAMEQRDLEARAWERVRAWAGEPHSQAGATLEDCLARALPAYRVVAGHVGFQAIVVTANEDYDGNLTKIFRYLAGREALMAYVDHYGPSPEQAPREPLSQDDYLSLHERLAGLASERQPSTREAMRLSDERAAAGDFFGAVVFLLEAANFDAVANASQRLVFDEEDLAPDLEAQYAWWQSQPPHSLLWYQAQEWSHSVLTNLTEDDVARNNHAADYARETLGRYAALAALRDVEPATDTADSPAPSLGALLLALAALATIAHLRRRRSP